ncbi:hypothetical protein ACU8L5_25395 (plasmid) [Rhizobium leguminosarum]
MMDSLISQRPIDASRFFKQGVSLLDATVLIKTQNGELLFNGVRITPEYVLALRASNDAVGSLMTIDGEMATVAWVDAEDALLLSTHRYDGAQPDLFVGPYLGSATILWSDPAQEMRVAFGHAKEGGRHDLQTEVGSMGAPLFDDAWRVFGLHRSRESDGACTYVPIAKLLRQLEMSPCWDEIAGAHRLARTVSTEMATESENVAQHLMRAVRWSTDGDETPMSERERRRAIAGRSLAELRSARGNDPGTTPEQRAIDKILLGPSYALASIDDDILLPFATAARWFRGVIPTLPDEQALEDEVIRRRQISSLEKIVGTHFAPRDKEDELLRKWLADPDRAALVIRGPGGIGKSALLAHFLLESAEAIRFVWLDFDRPDLSADEPSITRVVDQQLSWQPSVGPLVVVLDSFETAVQTYGYTNLNPALDALAARFDDLAVIVGSRTPVPLLRVQGEPAKELELSGLPLNVVANWLVIEGIAADIAGDAAAVTNGVPINMKLALEFLKDRSDDEARRVVNSLPKMLTTGFLYRRILRRLRDSTLKDVAQWAMIPRRIVPELIEAIFKVSMEESERLFTALRSELTLLEGDGVLKARADLRNTILPLLEAEDAGRVHEIDTIAARFWAARASDEAAAADAVYHFLRIGDLQGAQSSWRSGLIFYLGGYAMEELPEASQTWLEAHQSRETADHATEALVSSGDFESAAATLRSGSQGVSTLNARKRKRAIHSLAAEQSLESIPTVEDPSAFEAIVLANSRPAIPVHDGTFTIDSVTWSHLGQQRSSMENAIASTGRVELANGDVLGTASRIGPSRFITTRTVAERFAVGVGHAVKFIESRNPAINMRAEEGTPQGETFPISGVVLIHPYWDIAVIEAETSGMGTPLALATNEPSAGCDIVTIGHPTRNEEEKNLLKQLFSDRFDVKRVMPGKYLGKEAVLSFGRTVNAGRDDATALSADYGAPVIDVASGELIGVRFAWVFLESAKFVPAWELARDPEMAKAGVSLRGTPGPAPSWMSSWSQTAPARHLLLDAYVARTSGDLERARALLEIAGEDEATRIDRILLQSACAMTANDMNAVDLLRDLVETTPRDAWSSDDRDAAIATLLRLVVDGDAEREFLKILQDQPAAVSLLQQRHFRVCVPPSKLPWSQSNTPYSRTPVDVEGNMSNETVAIAKRIVAAAERCEALVGWIKENASHLADVNYLFSRSVPDAREIAGAYVAYPYEIVRSITDFLLDKIDLAPHPTKGWAPVVDSLFMMLRDSRGGLFSEVKSTTDLVAWLDGNAKSGRLGSYLIELLRIDTQIAWQAGLLHLTTELPIEGLLKRRFSGELRT